MALAGVTDSPKYVDAMRAMGEKNQWRPGPRPGHADDYAVIATYARLYAIDKDRRKLAPARALFNFLAARKYDEPLTWGNSIETRELAWCDALFMGPPAMAAVSAATGDRKYLDLANRLWWKTTDYLYDKDEQLYFRDSRYFDVREKNGKKVFWSRGNGWVIAGLARLLAGHARRLSGPRALPGALSRDGGQGRGAAGRGRLLAVEPARPGQPAESGDERHRLLRLRARLGHQQRRPRSRDLRAARAARLGRDGQRRPADGMLGWVQRIGDEPGATTADTTEVYGVGALLLAGSEIVRMATPRPAAAERALALGPFSVMQKARVAPSGDKHDFLTLAPYWWPDPTKPGGLPYIRRDGEVNPESKRDTDDGPFAQMATTVTTLAAAFRETRDERFAARAALLLRVWFLDPPTRMNPNLDYGQGVPGRNTGRGEGIIATRRLVDIVDAARLLAGSPSWTARDRERFQAWCAAYATWLQTSRNGREESAAAQQPRHVVRGAARRAAAVYRKTRRSEDATREGEGEAGRADRTGRPAAPGARAHAIVELQRDEPRWLVHGGAPGEGSGRGRVELPHRLTGDRCGARSTISCRSPAARPVAARADHPLRAERSGAAAGPGRRCVAGRRVPRGRGAASRDSALKKAGELPPHTSAESGANPADAFVLAQDNMRPQAIPAPETRQYLR